MKVVNALLNNGASVDVLKKVILSNWTLRQFVSEGNVCILQHIEMFCLYLDRTSGRL